MKNTNTLLGHEAELFNVKKVVYIVTTKFQGVEIGINTNSMVQSISKDFI